MNKSFYSSSQDDCDGIAPERNSLLQKSYLCSKGCKNFLLLTRAWAPLFKSLWECLALFLSYLE